MAAQLHAVRHGSRHAQAFLLALSLTNTWTAAAAQAQESSRALQRSVPQGFESLATPRNLQVPIVLNKTQIGTVGASVDLEFITFDDPAAVTALIPNVLDRVKVSAALSGPLPLNAKLACGARARTGCGQLLPDIAGVIYDGGSASALLFVNPSLRSWAVDLLRTRPQASEPAVLSRIDLNFSGQTDRGEPSYSLGLSTVAGLGSSHIRSQALVRNGRSDIDQLYARHIGDGVEQAAGLFDAGNSSFIPPERLFGARFGTTLDDLPGDAGAYDVPLVIALSGPASVDVFVGDRLLGSARYQGGEARIDTRSFPAGAYLVRLRITEDGQERSEERFFARACVFPPLGAPQTSIALGTRSPAAGFAVGGLDGTTPALHLTHRRRLSDRLGLGGSLHGREGAVAAEAELGLSSSHLQWSSSLLASSSAEFAFATSLRSQAGAWRLFGDVRRMVTADTLPVIDERRFLGVRESFWQASITASRAFGPSQLQSIALWRRSDRGSESWSIQPSLDMPVRLLGHRIGLRLAADFGPQRRAVRLEFGVPTGSQNAAARAGARWQRDAERARFSPIYEAEVTEQWRFAPETELRGNLRLRQDERESLTSSAYLRTNQGAAFVTLQSDLDDHRQAYFGNAQGGLAWTRAGLALTPATTGDAAVVYVNNSQLSDEAADALLGNVRVGTLRPQQARVQPVAAYRKATVGMLPAAGASLGGSSRSRETTLFPGTVAIVEADFVHVTAVFGQLLERDGKPIAGAVLTGSHGYGGADANGYFQIDVAAQDAIAVRRQDGSACRFTLTPIQNGLPVQDVGAISCD